MSYMYEPADNLCTVHAHSQLITVHMLHVHVASMYSKLSMAFILHFKNVANTSSNHIHVRDDAQSIIDFKYMIVLYTVPQPCLS